MNVPSRDLVLGTVEHYDWQLIRPFVTSLRRTGFDGEIHFFVSDVDAPTASALAAAGVVLVPFRTLHLRIGGRELPPYHPRLERVHPLYSPLVRALAAPARDRTLAEARLSGVISTPIVARFFRYLLYLTGRASTFDRVLVTDVRDVLFTRNPFEDDFGPDVWCFLEDVTRTLGSEPYNRRWLQLAYGEATAESLGGLPISCAGVTMGSREAVAGYLRALAHDLVRLRRQPLGVDQAVHNYVVHNGFAPNVRLFRNGDGPVLTLGIMSSSDAEALVARRDPRVSIVHQYDRHRPLAVRLLGELAAEEDPERILRVLVGEER